MSDVLSYSVALYRNQNSIVSYPNADVSYQPRPPPPKPGKSALGTRLVSYPVAMHRNLYAVVSNYVTRYRNLNDIVSFPVKLSRNVNDFLSYPVTIDCIQEIVTSYTTTVYYSRDAVMSYPIASCRAFFQVVQGEIMQYGEQLCNLCS